MGTLRREHKWLEVSQSPCSPIELPQVHSSRATVPSYPRSLVSRSSLSQVLTLKFSPDFSLLSDFCMNFSFSFPGLSKRVLRKKIWMSNTTLTHRFIFPEPLFS